LTYPGPYCLRDPDSAAQSSAQAGPWFHSDCGTRPSHLFPIAAQALPKPRIHAEVGRYRLRLAETAEDREAACRLRFKVFNIELGEGLQSSYRTGIDTDRFDRGCEHLLVEDRSEDNPAKRIVGTYRMQTGETAARNLGYYSEQEFSFAPYEPLRAGILELGRASIDREHRTPEVLTLLWRVSRSMLLTWDYAILSVAHP